MAAGLLNFYKSLLKYPRFVRASEEDMGKDARSKGGHFCSEARE